jgi:Carboxypeptidase regulatory-like domain
LRDYRDLDETMIRNLAAAALTLCIAQLADAQSSGGGRIEGIITDSVHARPLTGAHVVAIGMDAQAEVRREAVSDSAGRYRIDSLPSGRYVVGYESALLDSLEVTLSPREANLTDGQVATLDLALPSAAKLRSAVCLGASLPPETGVIIGHVVDAESESPLAGVTIAMEWRDLGVDRKTLRPINRQRSDSVVTDRDGWYRMCGVATGAWVSMQIQQDKRTGAVLRTRVDDTLGIAIRHLSLAAPSRSRETATDGPASAPRSGTATMTGIVRGPGGAPVASAEVRVLGTQAEGRTDDQGAFTLRGLPAGTQQLEVRRVGYAVVEIPVDLRSGATTTHDVVLRRIVNLDSVLVVASRPKYPDFYQHQATASGFGLFLGPEAIAKQRVARTSDIAGKLPGFNVEQRGYHTVVVSTRQNGLYPCPARIIIDGIVVQSSNGPSIDDVHPAEIGAMEVYRAGEENFAPAEYHIGQCGGIVIWTKR